ncbi:MAG: hypothetical protein JNL10_08880 [Verrucomicrobiales bacterium]|nr:hypothetical protein [Verrucomicrobiales bacterium]
MLHCLAAETGGFEAANRLAAEGKFAEGAAAYDVLAAGGRTSPALEFNRAQARFKAGQPGRAWAHLLTADRLSPRDGTLRMAAEQMAPRIPAGATALSGADHWIHLLTLNEWAVLALLSMWIWGILAVGGLLSPTWRLKLRKAVWISGSLVAVFTLLLSGALWSRWRNPDTVVLQGDTAIRVSPLDEARTAFSMQEGAELRSRGTRGDWVLVEEPVSRRTGWAKRGEVAVLPFR